MTRRWDIFCSVVDNYGDIGVAWRLARMLAAEHAIDVRLFTDDRARLQRIAGDSDAASGAIVIADWAGASAAFDAALAAPADVVVEAFACGLPPSYIDAMVRRASPPAWIVLEYLSAEPWIDSHHGLASPVTAGDAAALSRRFAFPGFTPASSGLLRERDLFARRAAFQSDRAARERHWRGIGVEPPANHELAVSLFCYAPAALPGLLDAWSKAGCPVRCLVPEGVAEPAIAAWCGRPMTKPGDVHARGGLTLHRVAFCSQDEYDRLLWACDLNFVRGEDSFVRAQWAARPLVWQAYPQRGQAHLTKVSAFLDRYLAQAAVDATALRALTAAWNDDRIGDDRSAVTQAWSAVEATLPQMRAHARQWCRVLETTPELAAHLVDMARRMLE